MGKTGPGFTITEFIPTLEVPTQFVKYSGMIRHLFAILVLVSFAMSVHAENKLSLAIVDMQRVIDESIIGKAARNNVEGEAKKSQLKVTKLKDDFERAKSELDKQAALLSGAALEDRKEQLLKRQRELERALQDAREDLTRRNGTQISRVIEQINAVVKEMANEKRYTFVLERDEQTVLYADKRIDITQDIIKTLDERKIDL